MPIRFTLTSGLANQASRPLCGRVPKYARLAASTDSGDEDEGVAKLPNTPWCCLCCVLVVLLGGVALAAGSRTSAPPRRKRAVALRNRTNLTRPVPRLKSLTRPPPPPPSPPPPAPPPSENGWFWGEKGQSCTDACLSNTLECHEDQTETLAEFEKIRLSCSTCTDVPDYHKEAMSSADRHSVSVPEAYLEATNFYYYGQH